MHNYKTRIYSIATAFALVVAFLSASVASAQTTQQEYYEKYLRLTSRLGYAGVGIETYIDRWEEAFPEDGRMLEARGSYYLAKALTTSVERKDARKFLGAAPVLTLKDSTGVDVNYFEEQFYDDELFGKAVSCIDRAIALYPSELVYRVDKISMLLAYEKEYPDMAFAQMNELLDIQKEGSVKWTVDGVEVTPDDFSSVMSGYCVRLYEIGTPVGYETFGKLSERLSKMYPEDSNYLDNIGSYWLVYKGNERKALKWYRKALKMNPDDAVASRNISIIERRQAQNKKKSR